MRILKDPFTGDLLLSLNTFESKQVKDKGFVKIMQKYEISQKLVQAIVNFLSTLPWNQVNQLLNSIALEVKENENTEKESNTKKI